MKRGPRTTVYPAAVAGALAIGLMASGLPALAGDKAATESETVSIYDTGWSSPQTERLALNLGQLLVARIKRAQTLFDRDELYAAQNAILDAEATADVIVNVSPVIGLAETIQNAKNKILAEGVGSFADTMIPINGYVDQVEVFAPELAKKVRGRLKNAENKAKANDRQGVVVEFQNIADEISATTYYLPVRHAYDELVAARLALARKTPDVATAKTALDNALDVVAMKVNELAEKVK